MIDTDVSLFDLLYLVQGAGMTLLITFWAVAGGSLLGLVFGTVRAVAPAWSTWPLGFLLDIFRSVPLLIQLILFNAFQAIAQLSLSNFTGSCIVLALYMSAYCSELVHGGILAVPTHLRRAGRSLGMSWWQDMRLIVFPIALRIMLPSWIGLTLGVLKDTALVTWLGIIELLKASQIIVLRTQEPLFVLLLAGLIYFALSYPIAKIGGRLEKRWQEYDSN